VPAYYCEPHHITDYATCPTTDINDLTFACGPHHRLLQPGGWTTRQHANGHTQWIPPPHLDRGQQKNKPTDLATPSQPAPLLVRWHQSAA
jgi:hypothetical protein